MSAFGTVLAVTRSAMRDLGHREIIWHVLWPPLVATVAWIGIGVSFWQEANSVLLALLPAMSWSGGQWIGSIAANFLLIVTLGAMIYCTTLILVGTVSLPLMMARIAARDYPDLQRHGENAFWGSIANTLAASAIFIVVWLLTLPLLLIPGAVLVIPMALTAWLNQRSFRFDSLAEHATTSERKQLVKLERGSFALAGIVTALAAAIPIVNLLAPGFGALVFVHLCLGLLRRLRNEQGVKL
ncbi:MAG: EI24 domain-containing protein [Georgfuchsia sp.]